MPGDDKESSATFLQRMAWLLQEAKRRNQPVHVGRADFAKLRMLAKKYCVEHDQ